MRRHLFVTILIATIFFREGFRSPRSTPPRYVRCIPDLNASSSCDNPLVSRSSLTLSPNCFCVVFIRALNPDWFFAEFLENSYKIIPYDPLTPIIVRCRL